MKSVYLYYKSKTEDKMSAMVIETYYDIAYSFIYNVYNIILKQISGIPTIRKWIQILVKIDKNIWYLCLDIFVFTTYFILLFC